MSGYFNISPLGNFRDNELVLITEGILVSFLLADSSRAVSSLILFINGFEERIIVSPSIVSCIPKATLSAKFCTDKIAPKMTNFCSTNTPVNPNNRIVEIKALKPFKILNICS